MTNNYYQKHKETLKRSMQKNLSEVAKNKRRKKALGRYQNFTEEGKEKKRWYYCEYNKNLSEERKQKLVEYKRNSYIKNKLLMGDFLNFLKIPGPRSLQNCLLLVAPIATWLSLIKYRNVYIVQVALQLLLLFNLWLIMDMSLV